jgi:hypothetical protein
MLLQVWSQAYTFKNILPHKMIYVQGDGYAYYLIWSLHIMNLYQIIILYPINMHKYYVSIKN